MTPEEFKKRAQKIYDENEGYAGEYGHRAIDDLLTECLISLGFEEGCKILWRMEPIWYS